MRSIFLLIFIFESMTTFACSDLMKSYETECRLQDQFKVIEQKYASQKLSPLMIKGFNLQKIYGVSYYQAHQSELLKKPFSTIGSNKEWRFWHNGQRYLEALNSLYLNLNDLLKLHQALNLDRFFYELDADSSVLRTLGATARPRQKISCEDGLLEVETVNLLFDFDLLSDEGLPLLEMNMATQCPNSHFYSGEIVFYKGASINYEMLMWINDYNDMIMRYEHMTAPTRPAPLDYLADMKRRFMSLRPFYKNNEEVVNALIDYALIRLNLPPMFLIDQHESYLSNASHYRSTFHQKSTDVISFFNSCLSQTELETMSLECRVLGIE